MEVQIHPDQQVVIRDDNRNVIYLDTVANFELDYAQQLEDVPTPWMGVLYKQGLWKRFYNQFTNETTTEAWVQGDDIITNKDAIIAAKAARESA
jgi:hypothetical protein